MGGVGVCTRGKDGLLSRDGHAHPIGIGLKAFWEAWSREERCRVYHSVRRVRARHPYCRRSEGVRSYGVHGEKVRRMDRYAQMAVAAATMAIQGAKLDLTASIVNG